MGLFTPILEAIVKLREKVFGLEKSVSEQYRPEYVALAQGKKPLHQRVDDIERLLGMTKDAPPCIPQDSIRR